MASTPSSSALSAVLRCRGNIWARNPPTRRPASAASARCSLGQAGPGRAAGARARPAWDARFLRGERVSAGRKLTVAVNSPSRVIGIKALWGECSGETKKLCGSNSKVSQIPAGGDAARAAVPAGAQNALVRHRTSNNTNGIYATSKMKRTIESNTCAYNTLPYTIVFDVDTGVLSVSITSKCSTANAGHKGRPSFALTGWSAVKRACLPLTALVSDLLSAKPRGVLCQHVGTGPVASQQQHLLSRRCEEEENDTCAHEANGQIHNPAVLNSSEESSSFGQSITEDRG